MDPLAEKTFESYGYVYNNPINLIDPTGMSAEEIIIIGAKDNNLTYENGKLYKDGSEYTGKVDKNTQKTVEALNIIGGTEEGASMINELQSSKNEFTIKEVK